MLDRPRFPTVVKPESYDLLIANIITPILEVLVLENGIKNYLASGSKVIFSGVSEERESGFLEILENEGFIVEERKVDSGWLGMLVSLK